VELHVPDRDGRQISKQVTLAELESESASLETQAAACAGCAANFLNKPYGCFGCINYPIPESAERWLMSRVQPPGTLGADLCLEFMTELKVKGESIRQMRREGLLNATSGERLTLKKGFLSRQSLSADQLLETMLMAGNPLDPGHCFGVLFWLGAIAVDGVVPSDPQQRDLLLALLGLKTRAQKEERASLELGPDADSPEATIFATLLKGIYLAWVHDVPLMMSA
jgi:hypothetical protein